jgi:type II secretory pathway component PulK
MKRQRHAQGFVLVLVLAMLVVLSLLAGSIAGVTARLRDQAQFRQTRLRDSIDIASTRATVMYLLNTQRMTIGGLTVDRRVSFGESGVRMIQSDEDLMSSLPIGNEIAMDGRTYRGLRAVRFALQDERGLFGVNWSPPWALQRLLDQAKVPSKTPPQTLINRLLDYQDPDDLYRLNSMEAEGYVAAGLPPPTNHRLATPMELFRVVGWSQALQFLTPSQLSDVVSLEDTSVINVNTAPVRVLMTLDGMTPELVDRIVARRKVQPFLTETAFFEFLGMRTRAEDGVAVYPAASGTLKLWSANGGQVGLVHWTLTPLEDGQPPWREDYELIQSQYRPEGDTVYPVASRLFPQQVAAQR